MYSGEAFSAAEPGAGGGGNKSESPAVAASKSFCMVEKEADIPESGITFGGTAAPVVVGAGPDVGLGLVTAFSGMFKEPPCMIKSLLLSEGLLGLRAIKASGVVPYWEAIVPNVSPGLIVRVAIIVKYGRPAGRLLSYLFSSSG